MYKSLASIGWTVALTSLVLGCGDSTRQLGGAKGSVQSTQSDARIIGGSEASGTEEFAPSVALVFDTKQSTICTASILSNQILLTAAHCLAGPASRLRVIFGTDLSRSLREGKVQTVTSYKISPHWATRQNMQLNTGDIALVRFAGGLPAGFSPIKLLASITSIKDGDTVLLAGYGQSNGVQKTGSGRLRSVETTIAKVAFSESEILLEQAKGKGACHGDSGGPAYVRRNSKLVLVGVTSRGINDAKDLCNANAAYTSVPFYASWIVNSARELTQPTPAVATRSLASVP